VLKGWNVHALEALVQQRWHDYLQRLALPSLFHCLPERLQQSEVYSVLALVSVAENLQRLSVLENE